MKLQIRTESLKTQAGVLVIVLHCLSQVLTYSKHVQSIPNYAFYFFVHNEKLCTIVENH